MRTTIDIPDVLFRKLKLRASVRGVTMKQLLRGFLEDGLQGPLRPKRKPVRPLPTIFPATGTPLLITPEQIRKIEEEEDLEKYARSTRRQRMVGP
jgi:hypothetical protein